MTAAHLNFIRVYSRVALIAVFKTFDSLPSLSDGLSIVKEAVMPFVAAFIIAYMLNLPCIKIENVLKTPFFNFENTPSVSSVIFARMNNHLSSMLASTTFPIGLSISCCNNTIGFVMYCFNVSSNAVGSTTSFMRSLSFVEAYHSISYALFSQSVISLTDF